MAQEIYRCQCGKAFRRALALERHKDVHHSTRSLPSFECDLCGKKFGSRNTLTMHRAVHSAGRQSPSSSGESPSQSPGGASGSSLNSTPSSDCALYPEEPDFESIEYERRSLFNTAGDSGRTNGRAKATVNRSGLAKAVYYGESEGTTAAEELKSNRDVEQLSGMLFADPADEDGKEQSMDVTELLVEEIVSSGLFQTDEDFEVDESKLDVAVDVEKDDEPKAGSTTKVKDAKTVGGGVPIKSRTENRRVLEPAPRNDLELVPQNSLDDVATESSVTDEMEVNSPREDQMSCFVRLANNQSSIRGGLFVCSECNREFISEKYLSMHRSLHKQYTTTEAVIGLAGIKPEAFNVEPETLVLGKQKKSASSSSAAQPQQWTCQHCNKSFLQNSNYKNHMRTHSDERPFVCDICCIGFKERYHLKKHILFKHTTDLKEKCQVCGKCFKDSTAVRAHERIHSEVRPYGCNLCGKTFKTSECLWHHENRSKTCGNSARRRNSAMELAPQIGEQTSVQVKRPRKPRQPAARLTAVKEKASKQSQRTVTVGQSLSSNNANANEFRSNEPTQFTDKELEESVLSIKTEADVNLFDPSLQPFLSSEEDLLSIWDLLTSADANRDVCSPSTEETGSDVTDSDAGQASKENDDLAKVKGLECLKCVKKFSSVATFEKHMVMHNEKRPYRCNLCDNGFKLKVHLKKHHLYRHSNEYPCECSICGKRFKDSSAVRLHERIHSTDRPFPCHCGKSFKTRENLWGHRNRGPCDKTQVFNANKMRLFRSEEFGTILGVPVDSRSCAAVMNGGTSSPILLNCNSSSYSSPSSQAVDVGLSRSQGANAQTVGLLLANAHQEQTQTARCSTVAASHSVQLVQAVPSSCIINTSEVPTATGQTSRQVKVATLRLIKPNVGINHSTSSTFILPTAIVTPIQRETTPRPSDGDVTSKSNSSTRLTQTTSVTSSSAQPQTYVSTSGSARNGCLQTTVAKISAMKQHSAAEKCPTLQKCLATSRTRPSSENDQFRSATVPDGIYRISDSGEERQGARRRAVRCRKRNSISDDGGSSTDVEVVTPSQAQLLCNGDVFCTEQASVLLDCQDSESLSILDPLLPTTTTPSVNCFPSTIYHDIRDYEEDDVKYSANDPILNIADILWGDTDNTLSSAWELENESLLSDLSLAGTFGML